MKKNLHKLNAIALMLCLISLLAFCGCETIKGMGRDIKNIDQEMRDNAW